MTRIRPEDSIRVEGLRELNAALKKLDGLDKELRPLNRSIASDEADRARMVAESLGGVAAKVAPSVRASAGALSAGVAFGGPAYPMAMGAAFGGQGRPTTQQFRPHKGTTGYFPYPTIRADLPEIEDRYERGIGSIIERAGLS